MSFAVSTDELEQLFLLKYGPVETTGWSPRRRHRFGYYSPDDYYEALVSKLVTPQSRWLDVGSGRDIFPSNKPLATALSKRAEKLVGVDPSPNIHDNPFVHERAQKMLQDFEYAGTFTLATLRMVAEHVTQPGELVNKLASLVAPGGLVVIYTINVWSPVSVVSWATPMWFHHRAKKLLWNTEERDTFPVAYKMNTRATLERLFRDGGFSEVHFQHLDDCRSFAGFSSLNYAELSLWKVLHRLDLTYPENCLLGVYRRS
jgi:SAM-dependent methyltransferase